MALVAGDLFSRKERDVGRHLVRGSGPKNIADELEISQNSVYRRIASMTAKIEQADPRPNLPAMDRAALALWLDRHAGCLEQGYQFLRPTG